MHLIELNNVYHFRDKQKLLIVFIFHPQGNENRQCPLCNKLFPNPAEYTLHLKQHTDGTKCLVCGKNLSSANSLDRHLLVHSGEKPFECQQCGKAFTTNGNMNRHMKKRKHVNGSVSDSAEKKAKRVPNNTEISDSPPVIKTKSILPNCDACTNGFRNLVKTGLKPENFELVSRMDCERRKTCPCNAKESSKSSDDVESPQVCDHCGGICLRMSNRHQKFLTSPLFMCPTCNAGFISVKKFQFHKLNHKTSDQNQINIDMRKEEDKSSFLQALGLFSKKEVANIKEGDNSIELNNPKEVNNITKRDEIRDGSKKFENIILDSSSSHPSDSNIQDTNVSVVSLSSKQTFNVKSPLSADCASPESHIVQAPASPIEGSIVAIDNESQCEECGQIFDSKQLRTVHYFQIHLNKSVFPCPECDYVSKDKSTLTRHMRRHTGEKPYKCIICSRYFTTETNAKRHIKNKHQVFSKLKKHIECKSSEKCNADQGNTKCHYCRKDFGDSKLLTQHINAPDCLGKPFVCNICEMRFTTKNNCLRHMHHIHKLEKDQARESMIIDRFVSGNENEDGHNLERNEMILDAADSEIAHNENFTDEESIHEEDMVEENQNCTSDNAPVVIEMELSDVAIDMSKNSSRMESDTISAPLNTDTVRHRPSSTEVDVSYSMLRLSEEPYPQEQENALDLSIRPIDLTAKIEKNTQNSQKERSDMFSMVPPPAHTLSSPIMSKQSSHLSFRNYLSTIPYPAITVPFFPAPVPHSQPESDIFNIHMQSHSQKKLHSPIPRFQRKNLSCCNYPFMNNTDESNDSERDLCIVEDTMSDTHSNENELHPASGKQHANDNEINDLASVSSVIDTANSQDISKFLNPVTFSKTHSSATSELGTLSLVSKTDIYRNSNEIKKKFPCNQCNKSFDTTSALTRHMVIHTGQKKHKCSTCGKAFGTKSNCKRHELTHVPKNAQKPKHSTAECQNTSDTSNNNTELSNFSLTTDQTEKLNHTSELHQNSSGSSSGTGHIIPTSNTLATFSHLFSGNYCPTQNLVCEYCLNTYKSFTDLSNHMRELHPSEYKHGVRRFS